jgi:hypothetical protein
VQYLCLALAKEGVVAYTYTMSPRLDRLHKHSLADKALGEIIAFLKNHTQGSICGYLIPLSQVSPNYRSGTNT